MFETLNKIIEMNVVNEVILYDVDRNKTSHFDFMFIFDFIKEDMKVINCTLVDGVLLVVIKIVEM